MPEYHRIKTKGGTYFFHSEHPLASTHLNHGNLFAKLYAMALIKLGKPYPLRSKPGFYYQTISMPSGPYLSNDDNYSCPLGHH